MDTLHPLVNRIESTHEDIRAEVIVSDLLAGKLRSEDLSIRFNGQQKRAKSQDIAGVDVIQKRHSRSQLEITLNRDSIYDTLPEGIFHQPSVKKQAGSVSAMVDEYRRQQEEEEEARQFFAPFENELFFQKSLIESEEFKQLFQIQQSRLQGPVLKKLGINPDLPRAFTSRLLRMLPYSSKIAGDTERTEQMLSLLLKNDVAIEADQFSASETSKYQSQLGNTTLGADTVAGNRVVPDHFLMQLAIGPISKKELLLYKNNGWKKDALQTIINFFIPVEWDVVLQFEIREGDAESFFLNKNQPDARLGYTTTLQVA